jgi:ssDNA-binding Zn-finger/Zn-ribbon topoisomerase 1
MPERIPSCPKCNDKMELGFMPDSHYWAFSLQMATKWVAGKPAFSFWHFFKKPPLRVTTYRCPNCGYLESYAHTP